MGERKERKKRGGEGWGGRGKWEGGKERMEGRKKEEGGKTGEGGWGIGGIAEAKLQEKGEAGEQQI